MIYGNIVCDGMMTTEPRYATPLWSLESNKRCSSDCYQQTATKAAQVITFSYQVQIWGDFLLGHHFNHHPTAHISLGADTVYICQTRITLSPARPRWRSVCPGWGRLAPAPGRPRPPVSGGSSSGIVGRKPSFENGLTLNINSFSEGGSIKSIH